MLLYTKFAVSTCVCCCHTVVVSRSMMLESFYFSVYSSVEACQICHKFYSLSPSTEEVSDRHQSDRGGVALRGGGELLGEAVLPPAARVRPDVQQPLDVLQAAVQSLQASPGLRQHPQTGGEGHAHQYTYMSAFVRTNRNTLCTQTQQST